MKAELEGYNLVYKGERTYLTKSKPANWFLLIEVLGRPGTLLASGEADQSGLYLEPDYILFLLAWKGQFGLIRTSWKDKLSNAPKRLGINPDHIKAIPQIHLIYSMINLILPTVKWAKEHISFNK